MYSNAEDNPLADTPDLEESDSVNTLVNDRLEATLTSTAISTDTEVAGDMLNLTMGQPELPVPQSAHDSADDSDQDDNPLENMFKVPAPVFWVPLPAKPQLDPRALMAEAKFHPDVWMSYEKALRDLIVFMFGYYIDAFECHGAWKGHQAILALECFTVADQLGRFHRWYKRADLQKPGVMKTRWKELLHEPQDDCRSSYNSMLAAMGSPMQPSYRWLKLLGWYYDHVYHQSRNIGQLTQKKRDNSIDYNESVYN